MGSVVRVRKRKYDGSVRSDWEGALISAENNWLTILHHPNQHKKFASDGTPLQTDPLFIRFLNTAHPIVILMDFDTNGVFQGAKCDAVCAIDLSDNTIAFVDLDLDVIVNPDLSFYVRDQVEFERHRILMNYPKQIVQQAYDGIALAKSLVTQHNFPFDHALTSSRFILNS